MVDRVCDVDLIEKSLSLLRIQYTDESLEVTKGR